MFALPTADEITLARRIIDWFRALSRYACATRAPRPFFTRYGSRALSRTHQVIRSRACITVSRMACTGASTASG